MGGRMRGGSVGRWRVSVYLGFSRPRVNQV